MYFELEEDRDTDSHEVGRGREKLKKKSAWQPDRETEAKKGERERRERREIIAVVTGLVAGHALNVQNNNSSLQR